VTTATHAPRSVEDRFWDAWVRLCDLSPVVIVRRSALQQREENAMELGRDVERIEQRKELSTVATMLSAIQESLVTPGKY
jgi:hypothetical protein